MRLKKSKIVNVNIRKEGEIFRIKYVMETKESSWPLVISWHNIKRKIGQKIEHMMTAVEVNEYKTD